jgi:hypothetical protein
LIWNTKVVNDVILSITNFGPKREELQSIISRMFGKLIILVQRLENKNYHDNLTSLVTKHSNIYIILVIVSNLVAHYRYHITLGFWTLSIVRNSITRRHNVSETGSVSVLR